MITMKLLGKLVQRQLYDILSQKYNLVIILLVSVGLTITAFQFGETWMRWSLDKYSSMFNKFSDNINGRSMQRVLCQSVPIDIVYTWVNGTDPGMLQQLQDIQYSAKLAQSPKRCFYRNCVPSHFIAVKGSISKSIIYGSVTLTEVDLGGHTWTLIGFQTVEAAKHASMHANELTMKNIPNKNYSFHHVHWTTEIQVANTVPMKDFVIIQGIHSGLNEASVLGALPDSLHPQRVWLYLENGLAVVQVLHLLDTHMLSKIYSNLTLDGKEVMLNPSHLILTMPIVKNPEDFAPSRFEDKEELRYSLRSVEKYAPWVRHIFLVTNGQIPYWLNLDQPRLTIVTHEELFQNSSHLPTFSSPAIESHLHRIPGLSKRFLYLNDDVMFGKEVWPDDFYTEANGQKVYLSWPVPECNEGCPSSWIADGYCDHACNKSDCMWDGGDCIGPHKKMSLRGTNVKEDSLLAPEMDSDGMEPWPGADDDLGSCAPNCADSWLADKYCDVNCNVLQCGFDAGDCGISNYYKIHEMKVPIIKKHFVIPPGELVGYWNMSRILTSSVITDGRFEENAIVRTWALCVKFQVMTIILRPGVNSTTLRGVLKGNRAGKHFELKFEVKANTATFQPTIATPKYLHLQSLLQNNASTTEIPFVPFTGFQSDVRLEPKLLVRNSGKLNSFANVTLPTVLNKKVLELENQLKAGEITREGLLSRKIQLFKNLKPTTRKILEYPPGVSENYGFLPWEKAAFKFIGQDISRIGRKLLDTFGESLLHVNRLYNREFGYEARRVPAHMAHLIDKNIMEELQKRFDKEWDITSSHKIRSPKDMQYAFSYFYFLMGEKENISIEEIFDNYDADKSGTWSDREIRTLLTRIHELPLNFNVVSNFESAIINCSKYLPNYLSEGIVTPPYERYIDSKMPTVSKSLVVKCKAIADKLLKKYGARKKYRFEIVGENEVTFKMLSSNLSQVISCLDEVRRKPKKFVCLNDNFDPSREQDNALARVVLQDFYESILPEPSSFELAPEYRNRFLHVSELREWRHYRTVIRSMTLLCIMLLAVLTAMLLCQGEGRPWYRRLFKRLRASSCTNIV